MKKYIEYQFTVTNNFIKGSLIALLSELPFNGFEEQPNKLLCYIDEALCNPLEVNKILLLFTDVEVKITKIAEQNWNAVWESGYEPVQVENFVQVRAHFHQPAAEVTHQILITPKMSFGTGHHATTYLMMAQMETLSFANKMVIDFGTGTGVLAILAEKMGAASVYALDNDTWSVENATENILLNACKHITLKLSDELPTALQADIVLANINLNVILHHLAHIKSRLKPGGRVLFSGILGEDKPQMQQKLAEHGYSIINLKNKNNWLMIEATV